jgi:anti-sigma factor RsiW
VKREISDERLQDYLDGRLAECERAEIEALLLEDPDLARRVESWREIGGALRGETVDLPPGFHARARDRFERSMRARAPWGFRLLSWEAAGLAAAVVLAAVLFVPELMRHGGPDRFVPSTVRDKADDAWTGRPAPAEPSPQKEVEAPAVEDVRQEKGRRDDSSPEPELNFAPVPPEAASEHVESEAAAAGEQAAPAPVSAPGRQPPRVESRAKASAAEGQVPPSGNRAEKKRSVERDEALGFARDADALSAADRAADDVEAIGLPPEASIAHGIRVVDDPAAWEAWLAGPAGTALARLGDYDERRRLILVGQRGGADCSSLALHLTAGGYWVRIERSGASAGCAFLLPRDGRPVALEDSLDE